MCHEIDIDFLIYTQQESTSLKVLHALEKFTAMIGEVIRRKNMENVGHLKFHAEGLGMFQQIFIKFYQKLMIIVFILLREL